VRQLIAENKLDEAESVARQAYQTLDKAARKNVVHPRNAARRKGRLMAALAQARSAAEK
jgi:small subunit ribosomal protein S20